MFHLYKSSGHGSDNDNHYIQMFYRNSSVEDLTPLKIPGCQIKCTLNQFSELYKDILIDDLNECKLTDEWMQQMESITYSVYEEKKPAII